MFRAYNRVEKAHSEDIWSITWQGDTLLTGGLGGSAKSWNVDDNFKSFVASQSHRAALTSIALLSDNSMAITCSQDAKLRFYDVSTMSEVGSISAGFLNAWKLCISYDDAIVAAGGQHGKLKLWSVQEKEEVAVLDSHSKMILSCAFHESGTKLATAGSDGVVDIFDVLTRRVIYKIEAHAMPIRSIVFSGNLLFTASDDRNVSVIDVNSGAIINSFSHAGLALCVDPSPDRRHFVVGCSNHSVCLWDLGMQRMQQLFNSQHSDQVWGVAYDKLDPQGKRFASVGDDAVLQLYEQS